MTVERPHVALPAVAVIVLNYNGSRYLDACLAALERTAYPRESLGLVVVDNASQDGSADGLERRFPSVRVIRNDRNLGFAEGNDVGIAATDAPYVVLLNNDTVVDPGWLEPLVRIAESDPTIGACGPKLLFRYDSLPVTVAVDPPFVPARDIPGSTDERVLGVALAEVTLEPASPGAQARFGEGWFRHEEGEIGAFRWSSDRATLVLPVADATTPRRATLRFLGRPPGLPPAEVRITIAGRVVATVRVAGEPTECIVDLAPETLATAERRIQNAGQELLAGGHCRDRGSSVVDGREVHALDGAYETREEVFALCGAAVLLRRRMLEEVGVLDERFFMYYEDIDLCWRARLAGWRMVYVPEAIVRHVHAGSSVEWSPFFRFHVERNRLFLLVKNAPRALLRRELTAYAAETVAFGKAALRAATRGRASLAPLLPELRHRAKVVRSFLAALPHLVRERRASRRRAKVPAERILDWMVG